MDIPIFPFIVVVLVAVMNPTPPPNCVSTNILSKKEGREKQGGMDIPFEIVFVRGLFWVLCIVFRHGGRCEVVVVVE